MTRRLAPYVVLAVAILAAAGPANAREGLLLFGEKSDWREDQRWIDGRGGRTIAGYPGGGAIVDGDDAFWRNAARRGWSVHHHAEEQHQPLPHRAEVRL